MPEGSQRKVLPRTNRASRLESVITCRRFRKKLKLVAVAFAELDWQVHFLGAAIDGNADRVAGALAVQQQVHVELIGNLLAVDSEDHVAADRQAAHSGLHGPVSAVNSRGSRRAAFGGLLHQQTFLYRQVESFREPCGQLQSAY